MKKQGRSPSRVTRWLFSGHHLTEEAFLRSLDGELTDREADEVDRHIQCCWSCRSRRQVIEQGISDLFEYQNVVTAPYLPPPEGKRAIFLARLDAVKPEADRPSQARVWLHEIKRLVSLGEMRQFHWIAGALFLLALIPAVHFLRPSETVSADEILDRAQISEGTYPVSTVEPVVVRKVRISIGNRSVTRTLYRDVKRHRLASRSDMNAAGELQVKAEYSRYPLDWNSPLDAEAYRRWRAAHSVRSDRIVRLGGDRFTLKTLYSEGNVIETDLTLRASDYHAVEESVHLQDNSEIEIAELSYAVMPFAAIPAGIFPAPVLPGVAPAAAPHHEAVLPRPAEPDSATLAAAEMEAEVALHGLGADLGEQIRITEEAGREVLIEGVVEDEGRRQQLVAAIGEIPHTQLRVATIAEAAQQSSVRAVDGEHPATASVQQMVASPPLLQAQLNARFPDKDQRIAYVNQTLSLAQLASARAWALNRLADRHPAQAVALLNEEDRRQLQVLLADHISSLREDISSLQNQLGEILSRSSNTHAANTSVEATPDPGSARATDASGDWRDRIHRVHSSTEAIHEAVVALLSCSEPHDENDADNIEVNLRTSLTQLQTELQAVDQKVHETDLK
jgi:hypothetical protein